jgi:hypothetical protein
VNGDSSAGSCVVDILLYPAETATNLLQLSPDREANSSEFLGESLDNAEDNGPSNRDGNNGSYDGKQKACSDKRA